jgi:invasion protein IalB
MKRTLVFLFFITAYFALGASASAVDPRATQLTYTQWIKFCITTSCFIGVEARGQCHPSGGAVTIALLDTKNVRLSAHFGAMRAPDGVISVQIDQDSPIILPDQRCYASGCNGQATIDGGFVERLKQSQTITIEAIDAARQKLRFSFALADFAKVLDGPASESIVREEIRTSEEMTELMRRAEEERKAHECKE